MQLERRRAERDRRENWRVPVVCAVTNRVGGELHLGQAEDIGLGGITLRRPRDLPMSPETAISLSFDLPGMERTIAVDGLVVSDKRCGSFRRTGVRFVGASEDGMAALRLFCEKRAARRPEGGATPLR